MRRIKISFLLVYILILSQTPVSYANADNQIIIDYSAQNHTEPIEGAEFLLLPVYEQKNGSYSLSQESTISGVEAERLLNEPEKYATILAKSAKSQKGFRAITDKNGRILFDHLQEGIWLLCQTGSKSKAKYYHEASPALIQLPEWEDDILKKKRVIYPKTSTLSAEDEENDKNEKNSLNYRQADDVEKYAKHSLKTGDDQDLCKLSVLMVLFTVFFLDGVYKKRRGRNVEK